MTRRLVIRVIVFLLLGAIVNVAVAWGCALWVALPLDEWDASVDDSPWPVDVPPDWPSQSTWCTTRCNLALTDSLYFAPLLEQPDERVRLESVSAGMPMRSVGWVILLKSYADQQWVIRPPGGIIYDGLRPPEAFVGSYAAQSRRLPIAPIWPGFAINTIFYAGVLWVVFAIPGTVKRVRRRRRGQCPACGYDLRGQPPPEAAQSTKCPECGRSASQ